MHSFEKAAAIAFSLVLAAPVFACTGNVTIGEGADWTITSVPNKAVGTSCINDRIIDTVAEGASYRSHEDFVKRVSDLLDEWRKSGIIDVHQRNEIRQAAQRSDVGKTVTVRLIALNDFHGNLQSPGITMSLSRQDIKNVLEQQFAGCRGQASTATRIMLPSNGFKYTWDGSKACDSRISNVTLTTNGVTEILVNAAGIVLDPLKTYRVTVNNFMAAGGDGFTTFLNGTNLLGGAQDIAALAAYLQANFKAPKPPYDPGTDPDDQGSR